MVMSLGGIAPQGSLSLHTVAAHFWPKTICVHTEISICILIVFIIIHKFTIYKREYIPIYIYTYIYIIFIFIYV